MLNQANSLVNSAAVAKLFARMKGQALLISWYVHPTGLPGSLILPMHKLTICRTLLSTKLVLYLPNGILIGSGSEHCLSGKNKMVTKLSYM